MLINKALEIENENI